MKTLLPKTQGNSLAKKFSFFLFVPVLLLFLFLLTSLSNASTADWYVSPTGSAQGDGSVNNTWDMQTALSHPSSVNPGDTIWLRGGIYLGTYTSTLTGTPSKPIIVKQYPGERAIVDGGTSTNSVLAVLSSYTYYWGFEIKRSDTGRESSQSGSDPTDINDSTAGISDLSSTGNKYINLVIHDIIGNGIYSRVSTTQLEMYGNIIFYNGWNAPDRGHGHGIYARNETGTKQVTDNIVFDQFSHGLHLYGTEVDDIDNFDVQGNIVFQNGILSETSKLSRNILIGAEGNIANNPIISNNYTYHPPNTFGSLGSINNDFGYITGCDDLSATNNYFAHKDFVALDLNNCTNVTMSGNIFVGNVEGFTSLDYPSNTYITTPTGMTVYVRPNIYESGRAHIVVFNWGNADNAAVDLSSVLSVNQTYNIYDVQDYFGNPVASGTYHGETIQIPMTSISVTTPVGLSAPSHTPQEFGVFVLVGGEIINSTTAPPLALSKIGTVSYKTGVNTYYYTGLKPTFSGTGEAGATITLKVGGTTRATGTISSNGGWSLGGYTFSTGSHTVQLTAEDVAGNQTVLAFTLVVDPSWSLFPNWLVTWLRGIVEGVLKPAEDPSAPQEELPPVIQGNTVTVRLIDKKGNPLAGVLITLSSEPQTAVTDENGKATFTKVLPGEHTLSFEYGGEKVERTLNLLGDEQDYNIDVTVEGVPSAGYYFGAQWYVWLLFGGLGIGALALAVLLEGPAVSNKAVGAGWR